MAQAAVFASITVTEGWSRDPLEMVRTGDGVRVDPSNKRIEILRCRLPCTKNLPYSIT